MDHATQERYPLHLISPLLLLTLIFSIHTVAWDLAVLAGNLEGNNSDF